MEHTTRLSHRARRAGTSSSARAGAWLSTIGFGLLGALVAGSASAALREYRVHFEPSPSAATAGYTLHIGQASGDYEVAFDLGLPPASGGTIVYAVDLEDSIDLYVALRAYAESGTTSDFSNEIEVSAIVEMPPDDGGDSNGGDPDEGDPDEGEPDEGDPNEGEPDEGDPGSGDDTGSGGNGDDGDGDGGDDDNGAGDDGGVGDDPAGGIRSTTGLGLAADPGGLIRTVFGDGRVDTLTIDSLADPGDLRPVRCDLDGDGEMDLVVGFGSGSAGQLALLYIRNQEVVRVASLAVGTADYRENGEGMTYPACGDLDGDGRAEIVVGFGAEMDSRVQVLDDESTGFAPLATLKTDADGYMWIPTSRGWWGSLMPAIGDIDGDGYGELVIGLGRRSDGRLIVLDDPRSDFVIHPANRTGMPWIQVLDSGPKRARNVTAPAVGDFDGDGVDEIAVAFGSGSGGRIAILDDVRGGLPTDPSQTMVVYAGRDWYQRRDGATRVAFGDVDGDGIEEMVVGFKRAGGHELQVFDDLSAGVQPMSSDAGFISAGDPNARWFAAPYR